MEQAVEQWPKVNPRKIVLVNFVLDKSGSMASKTDETIQGFNAYIDELKKDNEIEYRFSLTLFDTSFENRHINVALRDVPHLNTSTYRADGWTALFDAVGSTIRKVESDAPRADKVLTVIMTDGEENSSREYTLDGIKSMIQRKEGEGNWTFVFLGATPNAWDIGASLGMHAANNVKYDLMHTEQTYNNMAHATMCYAAAPMRATRTFTSSLTNDMLKQANMQVQPDEGTDVQPPVTTNVTHTSGSWRK